MLKLMDNGSFMYDLPYFTANEIRQFLIKYGGHLDRYVSFEGTTQDQLPGEVRNRLVDAVVAKLFNETNNGHLFW
jgi:hypothetical protein